MGVQEQEKGQEHDVETKGDSTKMFLILSALWYK